MILKRLNDEANTQITDHTHTYIKESLLSICFAFNFA